LPEVSPPRWPTAVTVYAGGGGTSVRKRAKGRAWELHHEVEEVVEASIWVVGNWGGTLGVEV